MTDAAPTGSTYEPLPQEWRQALAEFDDYMVVGGRSSGTRKIRLSYLSRFARDHADRSPWCLGIRDLTGWMRSHNWGSETMRSARATLSAFYGWALAYEYNEKNPAARLPTVKPPTALARPTPTKVLESALATGTDRDRLMLLLGAHAGLRRAEIAALPWTAIHDLGLHVTGKGGHERLVPMSPHLCAALMAEAERRNQGAWGSGWRFSIDPRSPFVFPGARGVPHAHPDAVGPVLKRLLGDGKWTGHTLRHRFATMAYSGTHDIRAVQQLLGHASITTTTRYVEMDYEALVAAVNAAAA